MDASDPKSKVLTSCGSRFKYYGAMLKVDEKPYCGKIIDIIELD